MDPNAENDTVPLQTCPDCGTSLHFSCNERVSVNERIKRGMHVLIQSRTFPGIYEITNANPEYMRLRPMLLRANLKQATGLRFNHDIRPTFEQIKAFGGQLRIHVVRILLDGDSAFYNYPHRSDPLLQHEPRRKLPAGIKAKQFPLRTSTINESSVSGSIAVINDVYINQLKMTHEELSDMAILSINDQSTNARIRGAKVLRTQDVNPFTRLQFIQLGFGLFHLSMNLIWALLHVHRGSISEPGSLSYFFAVLDRTHLGCEHPDYHTLLATLMQILRGVILNAWKVECGYTTLAAFSLSNPTPKQLRDIANQILYNHVTPPLDPSSLSKTPHAVPIDNMNRNLRILTRDLLYVFELTHAVSDGDFGRVEDMLGYLTLTFRGAGSNNYCTETLHFIFNLKRIWTPEFADVMRDNMLVNLTGLEGHFMAIDLDIEHLVRFLKCFFAAKGIHASWDHLGDIDTPATVDLLQHVREQVGSSYHDLTHIPPDTDTSVQKIAYKVNELAMHVVTPGRNTNTTVKPVVDALTVGGQKLKSSTLATFNRNVQSLVTGEGVEAEEDEIPPVSFAFTDDLGAE